LKKRFSRRELKIAQEKNIVQKIAALTAMNEISSWKEFAKHDGCHATAKIYGSDVAIRYFGWVWFKHLTISIEKTYRTICPRKETKADFEYLLATIKDQIRKKEQEALKQQSQKDTTQVLPTSSPEKRKDLKTVYALENELKLDGIIIQLSRTD